MKLGKTPTNRVCRLCEKHKPLRKSHIISEFPHKPLYDAKHRMHLLSTARRSKSRIVQQGAREYLLCDNCEQQFSAYENHASRVLPVQPPNDDANDFTVEVEYEHFKLFQLSLLWRTGVTSRPEFQDIELGAHEPEIRRMLKREDPGDPSEYGCILLWPESYRDIVDNVVMSMGMTSVQGVHCVRLLMAGMCWVFFLATSPVDSRQEQLFLQQDGSLRINLDDRGMSEFFYKLAKELYENNPEVFPDNRNE